MLKPASWLLTSAALAVTTGAAWAMGSDDDKNETVESRLLKILRDRGVLTDAEMKDLTAMAARMRAEETMTSSSLERDVKELSERLAAQGAAQGEKKAEPEVKVTYKHGKGLMLRFGDDFYMAIGGRIQVRFSYINPDGKVSAGQDDRPTFEIRRARIWFDGTLLKNTDYKVQIDVANNTGILKDAFIDHRFADQFHVRAGEMKRPFGRQAFTGDGDLQFIDYSSVAERYRSVNGGDRSVGAIIWGDVGDKKEFEYYAGLFNGEANNNGSPNPVTLGSGGGALLPANSANDDTKLEAVVRLEYNPMGKPGYTEGDPELSDPKLGFAVNYMYTPERRGDPLGLPNSVPPTLHTYNAHTLGADVVFKGNGIFALGEFYYREIDPNSGFGQGTTLGVATETAFLAQGGYFFGTEKGVGPEFALRYGQIDLDQSIPPASVAGNDTMIRDYQAVFNYYFAGHNMKLQADYTYRQRSRKATDDDFNDHIFRMQWQINF